MSKLVPIEHPGTWATASHAARVRRRYAAERRFRAMSLAAVIVSIGFLALLLATMLSQGLTGFSRTTIRLPVDRGAVRAAAAEPAALRRIVDAAAVRSYGPDGPALLSDGAWQTVRDARHSVVAVPASSAIDMAYKRDGPPAAEAMVTRLAARGVIDREFNATFLTASNANDPTRAGVWGALKGSLLTMLVTLALAFPVGVFAAVYLEEFAPRSRWSDLIEVSINNLAAVPSIIFGLLGLAVFLATFGLPRSAPLVGGLTLALMTMPVIVIASRNAMRAVPPSIRNAALAIGASRVQVVFDHVLPLAMPGVLTGTIIGMARALGETAPLLMIGMRAFIAAPPDGFTEPATVLPMQIFLWSDQVDRGFIEKTSAAILVLLALLLAMNGVAIWLRVRFEARW